MKINRIKIDRFGGLRDFSLDFSDGFNLVFGNNEDGKSTTLAFLRLMFYGNATQKGDINTNLRRRFTSFSGEKMGGEVEFTHEGKVYLLSKQFGKTPRSDKTVLLDIARGEPVNIEGEIGETLFSMSCAAFERSIFISGFTPAEDGSAELSARLASRYFAGEQSESFAAVRERISDAQNELHTSRKKGSADRLAETVLELEAEKRKALENETERRKREQELEQTERSLAEFSAEKERLEKLLSEASRGEKIKEYRAEAMRREELKTLAQTAVSEEAIKKAEELIADSKKLLSSAEEKKKIYGEKIAAGDDLSSELSAAFEALTTAKSATAKAKERAETASAESSGAFSSVTAFFLSGVLFALGGIIGLFASPAFISLFAPAAIMLCLGAVKLSGKKKAALKQESLLLDIKRELLSAEENERRANDAYLILRERQRLALEGWEKAEAERKNALNEAEAQTANALILKKEAALILKCDSNPETALSAAREQALKLKNLREWLDSSPYREITDQELSEFILNEPAITDYPIEDYAAKITELEQKINSAHALSARLLTENENLLKTTRTIGVIENDIEAARRSLKEQEKLFSALLFAEEMLGEAYDEMRRNFAPELNRLTGELLSGLTGGKHSRTTISDDLKVTVSEAGEIPYSAEYLSSGSADQTELCLRLAIAKLTGGENNLPLLLDDVLMQYDDSRAATATKFLSDYAKENQVLLFTCHGYFKDLASKNGANIVVMK